MTAAARVARVNGPLVEVEGLAGAAMSDVVQLGERGLPGEVVAIRGDVTTVQAYEYTGGLAPGATGPLPRRAAVGPTRPALARRRLRRAAAAADRAPTWRQAWAVARVRDGPGVRCSPPRWLRARPSVTAPASDRWRWPAESGYRVAPPGLSGTG